MLKTKTAPSCVAGTTGRSSDHHKSSCCSLAFHLCSRNLLLRHRSHEDPHVTHTRLIDITSLSLSFPGRCFVNGTNGRIFLVDQIEEHTDFTHQASEWQFGISISIFDWKVRNRNLIWNQVKDGGGVGGGRNETPNQNESRRACGFGSSNEQLFVHF